MIKIDVDDYCHKCLEFEPDVSKPATCRDGAGRLHVFAGDTIVRCEHRDRCREIARFFEFKNREQKTDGKMPRGYGSGVLS